MTTCLFLKPVFLEAKPSSPLPFNAFDGGIISAETLGRGGTTASNRGTPASGSENPASLASGFATSLYSTVLFDPSSSLTNDIVDSVDPLQNKTMQYLSMASEKGVLFYEPIARRREIQITDKNSPSTDFRSINYSANAIGFAGVGKWGPSGEIGLSLAYLWSTLNIDEFSSTAPRTVTSDTAEGVRMNLGIRYPTGPTMWGFSIQNAPAFLWGKEFKREMLPLRVRIGNTWRIRNGILLSVDGERRFYNEGGDAENFLYVGNESFLSQNIIVRAGVFGEDVGKPEKRHVTAGASFITKTGTTISYAFEKYEFNQEAIKRSVLSFQIPFSSGSTH